MAVDIKAYWRAVAEQDRELWAGEQLVTAARVWAADGSLSCHVASFSELVFIAGDAIGARDFFVRGWEIFAGNLAVFKKIYRPLTEKAPLIWRLPL